MPEGPHGMSWPDPGAHLAKSVNLANCNDLAGGVSPGKRSVHFIVFDRLRGSRNDGDDMALPGGPF